MKNERLLNALEKIDEDLIAEAAPGNKPPRKKEKIMVWVKWGAMAACTLVIVGVGAPLLFNHDVDTTSGKPKTEGAVAAKHVELCIHIEDLNSDGFSGSIVHGTEMFKVGEQIKVVFLSHAYVVSFDGQVLEYDEESSNISELELAAGNDVDVFFHAEHYERAEEGSLSVYTYRVEANSDMNYSDVTKNEVGEGETNLVTLTHMEEIRVRIDEMFPDGFRGTIEVGTDLFKEGEQITIVAQDNVTVVQKDGSIFDYNELEPNIKDSDLAVGNFVWVGFQKYDYVEGNGKYNQIFAYHIKVKE